MASATLTDYWFHDPNQKARYNGQVLLPTLPVKTNVRVKKKKKKSSAPRKVEPEQTAEQAEPERKKKAPLIGRLRPHIGPFDEEYEER